MKRLIYFLFLSANLILFASLEVINAQTVVARMVGRVDGKYISSRQVQVFHVIGQALDSDENVKSYQLLLNDSRFKSEATALILEVVVALEAQNFNLSKVDPEELNDAIIKVQKKVAQDSFWKTLVVTDDELKKMISDKFLARNFIQFKNNSMAVIISDSEALKYYNENRQKFSSVPFEQIKDSIKSYLSREQLEERLKSWFEVIRKKYDVKVLIE